LAWLIQLTKGYQVDFTHTLGDFDPVTGRPGSLYVNYDVTDFNGSLIDTFSDKLMQELANCGDIGRVGGADNLSASELHARNPPACRVRACAAAYPPASVDEAGKSLEWDPSWRSRVRPPQNVGAVLAV
jgi:hypothetical protein